MFRHRDGCLMLLGIPISYPILETSGLEMFWLRRFRGSVRVAGAEVDGSVNAKVFQGHYWAECMRN